MIIFQAPPHGSPPIEPPTKDDGEQYDFLLVYGDSCVFGDSMTDLITLMLPEYSDIPDTDEGADEASVLRIAAAWRFAAALQGRDNAEYGEMLDLLPEEQINVLYSDKEAEPLEMADWDCPVPYYAVDVDYAPHAERERPTGNVVWINAFDERQFVLSLAQIGVVEFYELADTVGDTSATV